MAECIGWSGVVRILNNYSRAFLARISFFFLCRTSWGKKKMHFLSSAHTKRGQWLLVWFYTNSVYTRRGKRNILLYSYQNHRVTVSWIKIKVRRVWTQNTRTYTSVRKSKIFPIWISINIHARRLSMNSLNLCVFKKLGILRLIFRVTRTQTVILRIRMLRVYF